ALRSQFRYQDASLRSIVTPPRNPNVAADTVTNVPNGRDTTNTLAINQTDLSFRFNTGSIQHMLVTGTEISREDYKRKNLSPNEPAPVNSLFNPDPGAPYDPTFHVTADISNTADTSAIYVIDTIDLGRKWQVSGGARYDWFQADT